MLFVNIIDYCRCLQFVFKMKVQNRKEYANLQHQKSKSKTECGVGVGGVAA